VGGARFHDKDFEGRLDTVVFGCWPRKVFDWIGLFDEELVRNQDDEFNLRLHRAGGTIWQSPRIRSWYFPRPSLLALAKQYFQYGYWKVRVIQKHRIPASIRHLIPGAFAATLTILAALAPFAAPALAVLLCLLTLYAVALIAASAMTSAGAGWSMLPIMPVVIAAYQLPYGFGFLAGLIDFGILKRTGRFTSMSRG
jgi:succinoglycan biosynthesis protein ExoA